MARMIRNLIYLGISIAVALYLLQAFLLSRAMHR